MSWKGTAIPTTGNIEKVYLNTNLTSEEFLSIVENINYFTMDSEKSGYGVLAIIGENDSIDCYSIIKFTNGNYSVCIVNLGESVGITKIYMHYNASDNSLSLVNDMPIIDFGMEYYLMTEEIATQFGQTMQNEKVSALFSITPFEEVQEEVTLDDWAEDIADAIREKKGIENIVEYSGTPVPNSGSIGNIYQNGRASVEETKKIFASLTYEQEGANYYRYWVCKKQESNYALGVYIVKEIYEGKEEYYVGYRTASNSDGISFMSSYYYKQLLGIDFEGWSAMGSTDLEPLEFSFVCDEGYGLENDKLSSLISITPFEQKEVKQLIPRLNFAQEIRSIETGGEILEPTAVPISGMVEKVYFNFNVDVSKMVEVIKKLSFIDAGLGVPVYPIISNIAGTDGLLFVKINDNFYYLQRGETHLIASISKADTEPEYEIKIIDNRDDSNFYKNDFTQPMEFGFENAVELATSSIPDYVNSNELLKEMISITPIQKIESVGGGSGIIEVEDLPTENIDENAIYKARTPLKNVYVVNSANNILGPAIDVGVYVYYVEEVDTTPTDNIKHSAIGDMIGLYIYHIKDINDLKVYIDAGAGLNWYSVGELFTLKSITGMTYKGKILESEISDTLEDGYYLYAKEDYYKFENSSWVKINKSNSLPPVSITLENSTDSGANYYLEVYCQLGKYFGSDDFSATYQIYVDNILNSIQLTYGREEYFGCSISNISAGEHNIKIYFKLSKKDGTLDFEETWFEQTATFTIES